MTRKISPSVAPLDENSCSVASPDGMQRNIVHNNCDGTNTISLSVRTLQGQVASLKIEPDETINRLMSKIQDKNKIAAGGQRLFYAGQWMNPGKVFSLEVRRPPSCIFDRLLVSTARMNHSNAV